jgi:hypothetical protein
VDDGQSAETPGPLVVSGRWLEHVNFRVLIPVEVAVPADEPGNRYSPAPRGRTIFSWDRKDGESLADYVRRLESMLNPGPDGRRVDIFDHQIKRALNDAKVHLGAGGAKDPPKAQVPEVDHLSAIKKACESLTPRERAELVRWLNSDAGE